MQHSEISSHQENNTVTESVLFPDLSIFNEVSETEIEPEEHLLSPWAKTKIGTFQARLEHVLARRKSAHRGKYGLSSVPTTLLINMVNESFGFNGWSSEILGCQIVTTNFDEDNNVFSVKHTATVRITLQDGTIVESTGHGEAKNLPSKHRCMATSRKSALTDGLRNGFLKFSDLLKVEKSIKIQEDE